MREISKCSVLPCQMMTEKKGMHRGILSTGIRDGRAIRRVYAYRSGESRRRGKEWTHTDGHTCMTTVRGFLDGTCRMLSRVLKARMGVDVPEVREERCCPDHPLLTG